MSKILIIGEHTDRQLAAGVAKVVAAARKIGEQIEVAVFAADGKAVADQAAALEGVSKVLHVDRPENEHGLAAILAPQIVALVKTGGYSHVLAPGDTFGKDVLPRAAALLGAEQVSDVMAVHSPTSFDRPIYAGNAIVTVEVSGGPCVVATIRLASFNAAGAATSAAPVEPASTDATLPKHTRFVKLASQKSARPDLQSAKRVVSGGRALGSAEKFKEVMEPLADKIGAGIGASRAAVDSGYCANDMQVGQTGKIIAPELYIAVGISGAIQHLAGIKDARTIVAINKDPEAPIFEVADVGLVGDLFQLVPELTQKL